MPRAPRIEFAGALYHVMNRGDRQESIFESDADRTLFLKTLSETCESSGWAIHSFVLMGNHYHLLIETHRATLVKGMQYLNSTYTRRYNIRHKKSGHLFQGRYKALMVDGENPGYFLTVSDYIHLNPVRAKLVDDVERLLKDPWSSAGWLAGSRKARPEWLRWERVYGELGLKRWKGAARREYRRYLGRRLGEVSPKDESWCQVRHNWCLGSDSFVEEMKDKLEKVSREWGQRDSWSGIAVEELEERRAARLLEEGGRRLKWKDSKSIPNVEKYLMGLWIRKNAKVGVKWIAEELGMPSFGTLSHGIWRIGRRMENDRSLKKLWYRLET